VAEAPEAVRVLAQALGLAVVRVPAAVVQVLVAEAAAVATGTNTDARTASRQWTVSRDDMCEH